MICCIFFSNCSKKPSRPRKPKLALVTLKFQNADKKTQNVVNDNNLVFYSVIKRKQCTTSNDFLFRRNAQNTTLLFPLDCVST